ncbi:MAG: FxsB family radical SAM/SPASM domain protein [Mycobacterium sp.]|nr:FxsB family radical SAM/SPASM domain protein [Mycobacterium sp.]
MDLDVVRESGWHPSPFSEFIVKVHSRCNLACDYCYIYELADQSWRDQPRTMSAAVVKATARRVAEHARRHEIESVRVILHGGEPLLAGPDLIAFLAEEFRTALGPDIQLVLRAQTNAALLSSAIADVLREYDIRVTISLDGDRAGHDRHRRTRGGDGSYDAVMRGLDVLFDDRYRHLFGGFLAVVDLANDPISTYEHLASFNPRSIDFLLPYGTWAAPPPGKAVFGGSAGTADTSYGRWINTAFDHWYTRGPARVPVRLFTSAIEQLVGRQGTSEQLGTGPASFLVIETDGAIEQVDSLKATFEGATHTGLHVLRDDLEAAYTHPGVVARQIGIQALSTTCLDCRLRDACGGGMYTQRYRPGTGFKNPSVYCADLTVFLDHVSARVRADLAAVGKA